MKLYLPPLKQATGALAQLVEQRTENPCVPGSIPGGTTFKNPLLLKWVFLFNKVTCTIEEKEFSKNLFY